MQENKSVITNPMSSNLIEKYTDSKANIVTYANITNMTSLEQVFNGFDHAILFLAVESHSSGHFQCIYISNDENGPILNFMDSYGLKPDGAINKISSTQSNLFGQNNNLTKLIRQSKFYPDRYSYNDHKYQSTSTDVSTCGRYAVLSVILNYIFKKRNLAFGVAHFYKLMEFWKQKYRVSYDTIVSNIINKIAK